MSKDHPSFSISLNTPPEVSAAGWEKKIRGYHHISGTQQAMTGFDLYVRKRKVAEVIGDKSKKSPSGNLSNATQTRGSATGSKAAMARPKSVLTPSETAGGASDQPVVSKSSCDGSISSAAAPVSGLPKLSAFDDYKSLTAIREDKPCLLIGFDSEWESSKPVRDMLSWQWSVVSDEKLIEFVFIKTGDHELMLEEALGTILDHLPEYRSIDERSIRRYTYCAEFKDHKAITVTTSDKKEAEDCAKYIYCDGDFKETLIEDMRDKDAKNRAWKCYRTFLDHKEVTNIDICIVCHTGKVDLSSLRAKRSDDSILRRLTEVQGGVVSLKPILTDIRSQHGTAHPSIYPVSLSFADTMCHAPAGKKSLENLGKAINVEKVAIAKEQKEHMKGLLESNLPLFLEYASTDSVVTLLYASALYGYNKRIPVTITSGTAKVMKDIMMEYLGCSTVNEFNRVYRGLERRSHGKIMLENRPGFIEASSLVGINHDTTSILSISSESYHGGFNACLEVGYFPYPTYDYDLQNAYPTAMCLVPDINWENPIANEISRKVMSLDMFRIGGVENPLMPFVGYITFHFPDDCKYPCIPINDAGNLVYPLTSEGMHGVYAAGPYIWLALKLGAEIFCEHGYFLNTLYRKDLSEESRSLACAVKQMVSDRQRAKRECGPKSLEELILKTMVNSGYGKIAQNVVEKSTWVALKDEMESIGCSAITNPFAATMITAIVQVELLAAINQIHDIGYKSVSVTTDGFISDCPEDVLKGLDLYGLRPVMEKARLFLTGDDPELWEIKHVQDDLVNFCTRGNISLCAKDHPMIYRDKEYEGVCAHNSTRSGFTPGSYEDRRWLMKQVISRTGPVEYEVEEWVGFKQLVKGRTFCTEIKTKSSRMDFDMKRKPVPESFHTDIVEMDGKSFAIAHFNTVPFKNISEYRLYRTVKDLCTAKDPKISDKKATLRTMADWNVFWKKLDGYQHGMKVRDKEWTIIFSCIRGFHSKLWDIPYLSATKEETLKNGKVVVKSAHTLEEKLAWINSHNDSDKVFKESDWKNARRSDRQASMYPMEMIQAKLEELDYEPYELMEDEEETDFEME